MSGPFLHRQKQPIGWIGVDGDHRLSVLKTIRDDTGRVFVHTVHIFPVTEDNFPLNWIVTEMTHWLILFRVEDTCRFQRFSIKHPDGGTGVMPTSTVRPSLIQTEL